MARDISARSGQSKFRCHVELVQIAGDYKLIEQRPNNLFRVPDSVADQYQARTR